MDGSPHLHEAELKVPDHRQSSGRTYGVQPGWQVEVKSTSTHRSPEAEGLECIQRRFWRTYRVNAFGCRVADEGLKPSIPGILSSAS